MNLDEIKRPHPQAIRLSGDELQHLDEVRSTMADTYGGKWSRHKTLREAARWGLAYFKTACAEEAASASTET